MKKQTKAEKDQARIYGYLPSIKDKVRFENRLNRAGLTTTDIISAMALDVARMSISELRRFYGSLTEKK
jgi:hypothetical protein